MRHCRFLRALEAPELLPGVLEKRSIEESPAGSEPAAKRKGLGSITGLARYRFALGSMLRHRYQLATVQYGFHARAMASISAGVGSASRP